MGNNDNNYHQQRARQERLTAMTAGNRRASQAHARLAELHELAARTGMPIAGDHDESFAQLSLLPAHL